MNEKIALIGAGSAMFTRGLVADLIARDWDCELVLIDIASDALDVAECLARKMVQVANSKLKISATTQRRYGLSDATAVITTIAVGGRRAWSQDVLVPRRHGIFQPVGDSTGVGGASRALRMIPAMIEIARDIEDVCPKALLLNYGNPMSAICLVIQRHTSLNVIGLCHGPADTADYLADELRIRRSDLTYTVAGVNHFSWFVGARLDGVDLTPRIRAVAHNRGLTRQQQMKLQKIDGQKPFPADSDPFSWEMCRNYGFFPANGDRHVTEFFPPTQKENGYFGRTLGLDSFAFEQTIADAENQYEKMRLAALCRGQLPGSVLGRPGGSGNFALEVLEAIRQGSEKAFTVNLPNCGQIGQFPPGAIVECPAVASGGTLRPLILEPFPDGLLHLFKRRFEVTELLVEAAVKQRRKQFAQVLMLEGIDLETARVLSAELLAANAAYLPWVRRRKAA